MWNRYLENQEREAARNLMRIRTEARSARTGRERDRLAVEAQNYELRLRRTARLLRDSERLYG